MNEQQQQETRDSGNNAHIDPALEDEIRLADRLTIAIDRKVPDDLP